MDDFDFDLRELVNAIESIIPPDRVPRPFKERTRYNEEDVANDIFEFAAFCLARSGRLDMSTRLRGLELVITEVDQPIAIAVRSSEGQRLLIDRGILGAVRHTAQFLALYWAYDPQSSQTKLTRPAKPRDEIISRFFNSYFLGLRWAGNYIELFHIVPLSDSVNFELVVRFWAEAFLMLHEVAHIAYDDRGHCTGGDPETETRADKLAIRLVAALAQAQPIEVDAGFAFLGTQVALATLSLTEWAYFVTRPLSHPLARLRGAVISRAAQAEGLFPPGTVPWCADVLAPMDGLSAALIAPPPLRRPQITLDQYISGLGRFFRLRTDAVDAAAAMENYETLNRHMNYPPELQWELLARQLELRGGSSPAALALSGATWCRGKLEIARHKALARTPGLEFRTALEIAREPVADLPYSARIAALSTFLVDVGWDPYGPQTALI